METTLLVRQHPTISYVIDTEPVQIEGPLYIHRIVSGTELLWTMLDLEKYEYVALQKTPQASVVIASLYDIHSRQIKDEIGICDVCQLDHNVQD